MDTRVPLSIVLGLTWMLFAPFIFTQWEFGYWDTTLELVFQLVRTDPSTGFATWFGCGFQADLITALLNIDRFGEVFLLDPVMFPTILAWFSMGLLVGIVAGGVREGMGLSFLTFIVFFTTWLIASVFSGEDLALLFSVYLVPTFGAIFTGFTFSFLGGIVGGVIGVDR